MSTPSSTKLCPSCGFSNHIAVANCVRCGFNYAPPVTSSTLPPAPQGNWQVPPSYADYPRYPQNALPASNTATADALAIAALVVAILSLFAICISCISLPLAVIALVLGGFGMKGRNRGLAIAALITSGITVIGAVLFWAVIFSS